MSRKCDLLDVKLVAGNNVSHSNRKTKRRFYPNLHNFSFFSNILAVNLKFKLASSTARTISNKYGDIDHFLVNYRFHKLSEYGQKLRKQIIKKLKSANQLDEIKIKSRKLAKN